MIVYVAGKDFDRCAALMDWLRDQGHPCAFDWTELPAGCRDPEAAEQMRAAIDYADALVLVGTEPKMLGAYVEVGMALARRIPVILFATSRDSLFWRLPEVHYVLSTDALLAVLDSLEDA